ncbi:hypothetical protein [Pseudomonas sp. BF-RE-26]|uniref:hypothetical protein n=1 Tax=Pseudomonas sp. BF-RE-26 TaxID=2832396 RepID=UPI001CBDC1ED|nr:hypothetical protein [Pseudomonas sp. BF-RE-26]
MIDITNQHIGTSDWTRLKVTRSLNLIQRFEVLFMLCKVEQADVRSDTNATAPKPSGVNFGEYDNAASVCQATPQPDSRPPPQRTTHLQPGMMPSPDHRAGKRRNLP